MTPTEPNDERHEDDTTEPNEAPTEPDNHHDGGEDVNDSGSDR
jgi:hypothetical protein